MDAARSDLSQLLCDVNGRLCVQSHGAGSDAGRSLRQGHEDNELGRRKRKRSEWHPSMCVFMMAAAEAAHLVLQELVDTSVVSDVSQQHLSSLDTNFIRVHAWNTQFEWTVCVGQCCHLLARSQTHPSSPKQNRQTSSPSTTLRGFWEQTRTNQGAAGDWLHRMNSHSNLSDVREWAWLTWYHSRCRKLSLFPAPAGCWCRVLWFPSWWFEQQQSTCL